MPVFLIWLGHRLRERPPRQQGAFWGGVIGHTIALIVTLYAMMSPSVEWTASPAWRGFAVHWLLLVAAWAGALIGALATRRV